MEDKVEIYRQADLGGRVGFGERPAVLVVDFQKSFCTPGYVGGADFSEAVGNTAVLLQACRASGVPVIFTVVAYQDARREAGRFLDKCPALKLCLVGADAVALDPRLGRLPSEPCLVKKYASSFFGTDLSPMLVMLGVDTLIVTGCTTSGCVRATVVDGMQHGYRVTVPRECVADIAAEPHEANLFDIDAKYGDVLTLDETLAHVRRRNRP
jgi:nicotinamidase-related amidase